MPKSRKLTLQCLFTLDFLFLDFRPKEFVLKWFVLEKLVLWDFIKMKKCTYALTFTICGVPTLNAMMAKKLAAMRYISMAMGRRYTLESLAKFAAAEFNWMFPHSLSSVKTLHVKFAYPRHAMVFIFCDVWYTLCEFSLRQYIKGRNEFKRR